MTDEIDNLFGGERNSEHETTPHNPQPLNEANFYSREASIRGNTVLVFYGLEDKGRTDLSVATEQRCSTGSDSSIVNTDTCNWLHTMVDGCISACECLLLKS